MIKTSDNDFIVEFGKNLRKSRESNNLTLEELSKETGISKATLQRYETGISGPTVEKTLEILRVLNLNFSALLGMESQIFKPNELRHFEDILFEIGYNLEYSSRTDEYFIFKENDFSKANIDYDISEIIKCKKIKKTFISPDDVKSMKDSVYNYIEFLMFKFTNNKDAD